MELAPDTVDRRSWFHAHHYHYEFFQIFQRWRFFKKSICLKKNSFFIIKFGVKIFSKNTCLSRSLSLNLRRGNTINGSQPEEEQCVKIAPPSSLMPRNNVTCIRRKILLVVSRFDNKIPLWRFLFSLAPHQAEHALLALTANWLPAHLEI